MTLTVVSIQYSLEGREELSSRKQAIDLNHEPKKRPPQIDKRVVPSASRAQEHLPSQEKKSAHNNLHNNDVRAEEERITIGNGPTDSGVTKKGGEEDHGSESMETMTVAQKRHLRDRRFSATGVTVRKMTEEQRKRKRSTNRIFARKMRQREKDQLNSLTEQLEQFETINSSLQQYNERLERLQQSFRNVATFSVFQTRTDMGDAEAYSNLGQDEAQYKRQKGSSQNVTDSFRVNRETEVKTIELLLSVLMSSLKAILIDSHSRNHSSEAATHSQTPVTFSHTQTEGTIKAGEAVVKEQPSSLPIDKAQEKIRRNPSFETYLKEKLQLLDLAKCSITEKYTNMKQHQNSEQMYSDGIHAMRQGGMPCISEQFHPFPISTALSQARAEHNHGSQQSSVLPQSYLADYPSSMCLNATGEKRLSDSNTGNIREGGSHISRYRGNDTQHSTKEVPEETRNALLRTRLSACGLYEQALLEQIPSRLTSSSMRLNVVPPSSTSLSNEPVPVHHQQQVFGHTKGRESASLNGASQDKYAIVSQPTPFIHQQGLHQQMFSSAASQESTISNFLGVPQVNHGNATYFPRSTPSALFPSGNHQVSPDLQSQAVSNLAMLLPNLNPFQPMSQNSNTSYDSAQACRPPSGEFVNNLQNRTVSFLNAINSNEENISSRASVSLSPQELLALLVSTLNGNRR